MIAAAVRPIRPQDESAAHDFLAQEPYANVYLDWLLQQRRSTRDRMYCFIDRAQTLEGLAFFGRQTVLAASSSQAIAAFAELARDFNDERMIVGARHTAQQFWDRVRSWHRAPRLIREHQPVFVLDQPPRTAQPLVTVRRARASEGAEVARNSAAMIEQELGYDPRRAAGDFVENVQQMIADGLWWVGTSDDGLRFFCHLGPSSHYTVQLQGVWTPPQFRGRGYATDALAQICSRLLDKYPTVSLYVNDFNEAAIALYRKLGFIEDGALTTYLF